MQKTITWLLSDIKSTLKIVLPIRFILFIYAYTAHKLTIPRWAWDATGLWHAFETIPFFDLWSRWDSAYYIEIATQGYNHKNVAFYPFYPFLIRICNVITSNGHVSGLIIANISYVLAMVILFRYTKELFGKNIANNTIFAISIFPTSFFFSSVYSESTFLLVIVLSCYFFHKEKYFLASLFGALAASTRNPGIMLFPTFILSFLMKEYRNSYRNQLKIFYFFIILFGFGTYLYLQYIYVHNPFEFLKAQKIYWGSQLSWPHSSFINSFKIIMLYAQKSNINTINNIHIIKIYEVIISTVFLLTTIFMI